MAHVPVVVVGAGLAGLACARALRRAGVEALVLEASDGVGGRARTDVVEGFLLDRGFQVLLTAYPEAQAVFDYEALDLCSFDVGALIYTHEGAFRLADPWRKPAQALLSAFAPVGNMADKMRIPILRSLVTRGEMLSIYQRPEKTTMQRLLDDGFTRRMRERFWRPFFGGIFLDPELQASSRMMEFVFRMFSLGLGAVPRRGMGQLATQLAAGLPGEAVRCNTRVAALIEQGVRLASGEAIEADQVVLALPGPQALQIEEVATRMGQQGAEGSLLQGMQRPWKGVTCLYLAGVGAPPRSEPILMLDGQGGKAGPVLNVAIMSNVSPAYAPAGQYLLSASVAGEAASLPDEPLLAQVLAQLEGWFGRSAVDGLRHLRTYRIPEALPDQRPPWYTQAEWPLQLSSTLFRCGDWYDTASIDGALGSGRRAAQAVLAVRR